MEVAVRIGNPQLAEALLERFSESEQTARENVANLSWALGALASLREAAGDLRRAIELKKGAAALADPEVARKLEFDAARLAADKLGDLKLAAETYEKLHRGDPADREAWEPLIGVYRRLGDAQRLVDLLGSVVEYIEDLAERGRLRLERVRMLMQGLGLGDAEAAPLLREIVDEDATQLDAALMLAAILERADASDELADLLARQIESAKDRSDGASVASLALRLGVLRERTDRVEARNVYYTGLDWEPKSRELLEALVRLLGAEEDAGERAEVMERRLSLEHGPAAEEMTFALVAARGELSDEVGAQRALELGFRAHPASTALRERLEMTFREKGEWRKLAELCVLDASARVDSGERVARLREAAAIYRSELEDPRGAAAALHLAREAAPDDATLLRDRVDMLIEAGEHAAAVTELTGALDRVAAEDPRRGDLFAARARVRMEMEDPSGALEDLETAFAIDRGAYAEGLAAQLEQLRTAAAASGETARLHILRLRQAQVMPYAGDTEGARAVLGELVKQDPKDRAALRTLANLESGLERWDAASAALKRLVGLEEGDEAVETTLRLADACERAGRAGDARGALERARLVVPQDRAVRERLERVYEKTEAWHELAEMALEDARASGDVADRFALLTFGRGRCGSNVQVIRQQPLRRWKRPTLFVRQTPTASPCSPMPTRCPVARPRRLPCSNRSLPPTRADARASLRPTLSGASLPSRPLHGGLGRRSSRPNARSRVRWPKRAGMRRRCCTSH